MTGRKDEDEGYGKYVIARYGMYVIAGYDPQSPKARRRSRIRSGMMGEAEGTG